VEDTGWLRSRPSPHVELGDVVLSRWRPEHVDRLHEAALASLPELRPWMPWADGYDRCSAERFLDTTVPAWDEGRDLQYAIEDRDGLVVGSVGLHARIGAGGLEIGYWVRTSHTGRGLATLAAAAVTVEAFGLDEVDRVEIHHDRANLRSGRVPRRLGFVLVDEVAAGSLRAPEGDGVELVWRLTAGGLRAAAAGRVTAAVAAAGRRRGGS
jgi:ribosomal-protein-serine acetyltransferase